MSFVPTFDSCIENVLFASILCVFYYSYLLLGYSELSTDWQVMAPRSFSLICFRLKPLSNDADNGYSLNAKLVEALNCGGDVLVTHTVCFY